MSDLIKYSDANQYQLVVLPVCGTHGIQMEYRKTEGECEVWGGVWYDCPKCFSSIVFKADQEKHVPTQGQSAGGGV